MRPAGPRAELASPSYYSFADRLHTVDDVPTTKHKSARRTSMSISSICRGTSPNHTTPGLASAPQREHRGNFSAGMFGSIFVSSSVPASAGQMGDDWLDSWCPHGSDEHCISIRRPCISRRRGCLGASAESYVVCAMTSSSARLERPSTF